MNSLDVIKKVALGALVDPDDEEPEDPHNMALFRAACDPESVLEMADMIDRLIGFIEAHGGPEGYALLLEVKQALHIS